MAKRILGKVGRVVVGCVMGGAAIGAGGAWRTPEPPHAAPATTPPAAKKDATKPAGEKPDTSAAREEEPSGRGGKSAPSAPPAPLRPRSAFDGSEAPKAKPGAGERPSSRESAARADADSGTPTNSADALKQLRAGNERWVSGSAQNPDTDAARRRSQAEGGQTPFAAVLTCADSRIPVERVFDQGVGDLFVLRVAGNVAGAHEAGSLEYAVAHLNVPVLVVMGHTKCGAVAATVGGGAVDGNLPSLVEAIGPAVARAKRLNPDSDDKGVMSAAVRENVWQTIFDLLKSSDPLRTKVAAGELEVVGAVYDIADGTVQWMGEHPWQSELVAAFSKKTAEGATAEAHAEH